MMLLSAGVSHASASVELREKLVVPSEKLNVALECLVSNDVVSEAVVLSTCNRTEVYATVVTVTDGIRAIFDFLQGLPGMKDADTEALAQALVVKQGPGAVEHLFRVASSLDSIVLGEAQIIGQVRRAFAAAESAGAVGEVTRRLFRSALEVGKRVRDQTAIGCRSVSISTAAVQLAERELGTLDGRRALVVGAGEMGMLALGYLKERGVENITVVNRTFKRAREAAARVGGKSVKIDQLEKELARADLVVACAGGEELLVTRAMMSRLLKKRIDGSHRLVTVDVGMPRAVDPECARMEGIVCFDLDDIGAEAAGNARIRAAESVRAEALVAEQVDDFLSWMQEQVVTPTVKQMHGKARDVCELEVARAAKALAALREGALSDGERAVLDSLANAVAKKLLHGPTARLRKQASDPDAYRYTEAARYLFGLDAYPQGFSCRSDDGRMCRLSSGSACARRGCGACPHDRKDAPCLV